MSSDLRLRANTTQSSKDAATRLSLALVEWLQTTNPTEIYVSCRNCKHMTQPPAAAFCALYNMTPPVDVIITGCPSHQDVEEIPF